MNILPLPPQNNNGDKRKLSPWLALNCAFLDGVAGTFKHEFICKEAGLKLQCRLSKDGQQQFRIACSCGAHVDLPQAPLWADAWKEVMQVKEETAR